MYTSELAKLWQNLYLNLRKSSGSSLQDQDSDRRFRLIDSHSLEQIRNNQIFPQALSNHTNENGAGRKGAGKGSGKGAGKGALCERGKRERSEKRTRKGHMFPQMSESALLDIKKICTCAHSYVMRPCASTCDVATLGRIAATAQHPS